VIDSKQLKGRYHCSKRNWSMLSNRRTIIRRMWMNSCQRRSQDLKRSWELLRRLLIPSIMSFRKMWQVSMKDRRSGRSNLKIFKQRKCLRFIRLWNSWTRTYQRLPRIIRIDMIWLTKRCKTTCLTLTSRWEIWRRRLMLRIQLLKIELDFKWQKWLRFWMIRSKDLHRSIEIWFRAIKLTFRITLIWQMIS